MTKPKTTPKPPATADDLARQAKAKDDRHGARLGVLVVRLPARRSEARAVLLAHVQRCLDQGMSTKEIARRTLAVRTGFSERWVRKLADEQPFVCAVNRR